MPTATQDTVVSQPAREVVYAARRSELRLVQVPEYPILNAQGAKTGRSEPHRTFAFRDGILRVPLEGTIATEHGVEVPVEEVLPWLEGHRRNGDRSEGFFKVEISAPPVSAEEMLTLVRLGQAFDRKALEELIAAEQAGWNREPLLAAARESLAGIDQIEAERTLAAQKMPRK